MTAFEVIRFAQVLKPRWVIVENVIHMRSWSRYEEWLGKMRMLGYHYRDQVLNAAHFGVPQSRKRLFVMFDLIDKPPKIQPPARVKAKSARVILSQNGKFPFSALKTATRARPTLERAKRAIAKVGKHRSFLIVYYGTDGSGGWQGLNVPLRTITTLDRFAYVRRSRGKHLMRMLQVPELKKAMGLPARFQLNYGTRRDKVKLMGNAVCPQVIQAIVRRLLRDARNRNLAPRSTT